MISMKTLFLCYGYGVGGVNSVTQTLSKRFAEDGNNVGIFTFDCKSSGMEQRYTPNVKLYSGVSNRMSLKNIMLIRRALKENEYDIIINNWGMRPWYIFQVKLATIGLQKKPKIVSVYHSDPCINGALMGVDLQLEHCKNTVKRWLLNRKRQLIKSLTAFNFRISYAWSDRFLVLSPSFVKRFGDYACIKDLAKVRVQANPITVEPLESRAVKVNEILYVGQLRERLKRVSRLMEVWKELESQHPNWHMTILGEGHGEKTIRQQIKQYGLKNVSLEGYQNPSPYYQRAKLLLLVSESEGFGLVIIEGMQSGVVPVVYGSYPAVYDIIEDGKDGIILPYRKKGFDAKEVAERLESLLNDENKIAEMANCAKESSKRFSRDRIANQWYQLFEELKDERKGTIS